MNRSREELEAAAASWAGRWWHSIELGEGVVTPGTKPLDTMRREIAQLELPADLSGKSVLDIGAWDGGFSFEMERRGADRVVALDHYIWSIDNPAQQAELRRCVAAGISPRPWEQIPEVWKPDELPGRGGFDAAREVLDSKVEPVVGDFQEIDLDGLGRFDVVLYLGVLYHVHDPFRALQRVARVTKGVAVIETELVAIPGAEHYGAWEFIAGDALGHDPTNWWVPNRVGLISMLEAAGFARVEMDEGPTPRYTVHTDPRGATHAVAAMARRQWARARPVLASARHAWAGGAYPPVAPVRYRSIARAYMDRHEPTAGLGQVGTGPWK